MDSRWRNAGIAEITMQAYADRHGLSAGRNESDNICWRPRAKPIALTIVCIIIVSLAVYWLIVGPIFESQKQRGKISRGERNCD
ncbi:hypothetical protein G9C98_008492 [Cotesia typhae]|uniref:Uncharacterized protein n=1 Tax=Cotesia typhae TaxID=2053667 RepID=A0A8J5QXS1_9HYME|nr:hypothetical protein G9C98_008492 [Cotesia typhae]